MEAGYSAHFVSWPKDTLLYLLISVAALGLGKGFSLVILFLFSLFVCFAYFCSSSGVEQVKVAACRKEVAGEKERALTAATGVEMVAAEEIVTVAAVAVTMATGMRDI